jgi:hypothetical protein
MQNLADSRIARCAETLLSALGIARRSQDPARAIRESANSACFHISHNLPKISIRGRVHIKSRPGSNPRFVCKKVTILKYVFVFFYAAVLKTLGHPWRLLCLIEIFRKRTHEACMIRAKKSAITQHFPYRLTMEIGT